MHVILIALALAVAIPGPARHYIVQAQHVLLPADVADLAARGIEVQRVLPERRYLVRTDDVDALEHEGRIRNVEAYSSSKKIAASAYRQAAGGRAFSVVRLMFHDDVTFEDARAAIESAGGTIDRPLTVDFELPHRLQARVPSTAIGQLANDERVFAIYGPPLRIKEENAVAAQLSRVTPLFSAPYNLSGAGVVLSLFELAPADATHPEFGGRLTTHISGSATGADSQHPTHVSGTMIASGLNPQAKGMAPAATLHEFEAKDDFEAMLNDKSTALTQFSIIADNNSWGYSFGWQANTSGSGPAVVWYGDQDLLGAYTALDSAPYDKVAHDTPVLFVHSTGNDQSNGNPSFGGNAWAPHAHVDNLSNVINETFCYSQNGSGTDCPTPMCSAGQNHCETSKHPAYGPYTTTGLIAATKNVVAVGAVSSSGIIGSFSSLGPTRDGRVKPDVVAKGVSQFSTLPSSSYGTLSGTSMSSPVVTGICALLTEQWRKTFNGQSPTPETLKTLLIAGADDLGIPGPDYVYGFGLVDAKASVDLILADNNSGSRIRTADIAQGQQIETTFGISSTQNVRLVLGWADPEVALAPDEVAGKTLVNDLDLRVIDPSGATVLPYVLDPNNPSSAATHGVNNTDNVEELEIKNAVPGTYHVIVTGTNVARGPTQTYVLVGNAPLGTTVVTCTDQNEPNDTVSTATPLPNATPVLGRFCSQSDIDYFEFNASAFGTVTIIVSATDTPTKVTVFANGNQITQATVAAGENIIVQGSTSAYVVRLEPAGTIGSNAGYTITATYSFAATPRRRSTRH